MKKNFFILLYCGCFAGGGAAGALATKSKLPDKCKYGCGD